MTSVIGEGGETVSPVLSTQPAWGKDRGIFTRNVGPLGDRARHQGEFRMDAKTGPEQVERVVAALKRATVRLINFLKSEDAAVRAAAADALRALDPPPIRDLTKALLKAKDTSFKVELIQVLGGLGEAYRTHVTLAFAELWQGGDPVIRRAIFAALCTMGPAPVEPRPTPAAAAPTQLDAPRGRARTRLSPPRPRR